MSLPTAKRRTGTKWEQLIAAPNAQRWLKRPRGPKSVEILPGIRSTDQKYLYAMERLADELNSQLPTAVLEDGFVGPSGVGENFNKLLNVSGYSSDPLPLPLMDNSLLRAEKGLNADFESDADRQLFDQLVDVMFGYNIPTSLPIRKIASTNIPWFTSEIIYKKTGLVTALHNIDKYLDAQVNFKPEALTHYHSVLAYSLHERQQPDSGTIENGRFVPKERFGADEQYARTGGREGKLLPINKTVVIDGREMRMHAAMRRRPVWGLSFIPNYVISALLAPMRAVYLDRFEFTWKHRSAAQKAAKLARFKYILGSDVSTMDALVPKYMLNRMCQRLGERHLREDAAELIRLALGAPYVVPPPWRDTKPGYSPFFGDYPDNKKACELSQGLASGIAINPDAGKLIMTFTYLAMLQDLGVDVMSNLELFLQGQHPRAALLDMSDDAVIAVNEERLRDAVNNYKSKYMQIGPETPAKFLGSVFGHGHAGPLAWPNIATYAINFYAPEKGIESRERKDFWSLGFKERGIYYADAPSYRTADGIIERVFKDVLGLSPRVLAEMRNLHLPTVPGLTSTDMMVLQNPHYLHYRVSPEELSPVILDQLVSSLPADEYYPHIKHLYRNNS